MIYEIRHFDTPVLRFSADDGAESNINVIWITPDRELLPLDLGESSNESVASWINHRTIPRNRAYVHTIKKAFNVKEMARILVDDYNGVVPQEREILENLPGVGRKTANVFLSEYLHLPAIAVDTHVERVTKRLTLVRTNSNVKVIERTLMRNIKKDNWSRRHLQLVLFGRYYCKAKKPLCDDCQLKDICKETKKK